MLSYNIASIKFPRGTPMNCINCCLEEQFTIVVKNKVQFNNVPVKQCVNCGQKEFAMRDLLILEHYAKQGLEKEKVEFEDISVAYQNMSINELISYSPLQ